MNKLSEILYDNYEIHKNYKKSHHILVTNLTRWDIIPFGLVPLTAGIMILALVDTVIDLKIDSITIVRTSFGTTLGAIVFTYVCKRYEDKKYVKIEQLKDEREKLLRIRNRINESIDGAKIKIENLKKIKNDSDKILTNYLEKYELIRSDLENEYKTIVVNIAEKTDQINKKIAEAKIEEDKNYKSQIGDKFKKLIEQYKEKNKFDLSDEQEPLITNVSKFRDKVEDKYKKLFPDANKLYLEDIDEKINRMNEIFSDITLPEKLGGKKEESDEDEDKKNSKDEKKQYSLIFAAIYAMIAALAITTALEHFVDPDENQYPLYAHNILGFPNFLISNSAIIIASFFPTAIMFVHCGIIFLVSDAKDILAKGSRINFFMSTLLIFFESVVLYYAGTSINNVLNYSFWIFLLCAIDAIWVGMNWSKAIDAEPQWLSLDLTIVFFMVTILLTYPSLNQVEPEVYYWILVVLLATTVVDYLINWKSFWSKYNVSDELF